MHDTTADSTAARTGVAASGGQPRPGTDPEGQARREADWTTRDPDRAAEMWARCARVVARLAIPQPFEPAAFVLALSQNRARRIEVVIARLPAALADGLLVRLDGIDYVVIDPGLDPTQARFAVLLQIGHLLLGHVPEQTNTPLAEAPEEHAARQFVTPHLTDRLVRQLAGHGGLRVFTHQHRRDAELFATALMLRQAEHGEVHR